MATITITKQWANGQILLEADLDFIKSDIETFINVTKLNDDNLQNAGITASSKLIDGTISTGKLQNAAVTDTKLATNAVTTIKITDANVTAAKLAADVFTTLIPIGTIWPYAASTAPSASWLLCDGSAVSRTTYSALNTLLAASTPTYPYGNGDTTTTFNLPDLRGRVPAGQDDMGGTSANRLTNPGATTGGIDGDVLGGTGGLETHTLTTAQSPAHTHSGTTANADKAIEGNVGPSLNGSAGTNIQGTGSSSTTYSHSHSFTTDNGTGGGTAHNNVQPTLIVNYIIRVL